MRALRVGVVVCGGAMLIGVSAATAAEDATSAERPTVKKTEDGLHFNLPADWPIEKRGGITAPIPIE